MFTSGFLVAVLIASLLFYFQEDRRKAEIEFELYRQSILTILIALNQSDNYFPYYDVKPYVLARLEEYHKPRNSPWQEYAKLDGRFYSAHPMDPFLFTFVCIGQYSVLYGDDRLRAFCDKHIEEARRADHYFNEQIW